jgi:hypothetical protein
MWLVFIARGYAPLALPAKGAAPQTPNVYMGKLMFFCKGPPPAPCTPAPGRCPWTPNGTLSYGHSLGHMPPLCQGVIFSLFG